MATVKKVVKALKKIATKEPKKVVLEKVSKVVTCEDCGGRGLKDQHTLCARCEGHGQLTA